MINSKLKPVLWIICFLLLISIALGIVAAKTIQTDPFFHYHKPNTDIYYYKLDNERSQNDGIIKHFDYSGMITGTSMTQNFKTSEAEALWQCDFIKVPFSGALYKEINDNIITALQYNPELKIIIRGLDYASFLRDKDEMRLDLGDYPYYLYDEDPFNDVRYIFNRDVVFSRTYQMIRANDDHNSVTGITSFDYYKYWMNGVTFGKNTLYPDSIKLREAGQPVHLNEEEAEMVKANIWQNVTSAAKEYPNVSFYYFLTPYSAEYWRRRVTDGTIYQLNEAEELMIEEILKLPNIKLYSFNTRFDITMDLNNYKDLTHYGEWINSMMLYYMHNDQYLLTKENYKAYLEEELNYYTSYDYSLLNDQVDYDNDYYIAYLLEKDAYGLTGQKINLDDGVELQKAELIETNDKTEILCVGNLQREKTDKVSVSEYIRDVEFVGFKITIDDISPFKFLTFYGKKYADQGQPTVCVYNSKGDVVTQYTADYQDMDSEWKQYIINVRDIRGETSVVFNGGYVDNSGDPESKYAFSEVILY